MSRTKKFSNTALLMTICGLALVLILTRLGEYFLDDYFGDNDGHVATPFLASCLAILYNLMLTALAGLSLWLMSRKTRLTNLLLSAISVCCMLAVFEFVLLIGKFDTVDTIWIPQKYKMLDAQIDAQNRFIAEANQYGFTDKERQVVKPEGMYRIAVLGDSFVWGDGIPYQQSWSHKLERKMQTISPHIEVMSWGKNGWSTAQEFTFLKESGHYYNLDLLIVGFVTNDPDLGHHKMKLLRWQESFYLWRIGRRIFPNTCDFVSAYLNQFIMNSLLRHYGYVSWENNLYSPENLRQYAKLLQELANYCREKAIPLLFVLTPNTYHPHFAEKYASIIPLLERANIAYLNLYPQVVTRLKHYTLRELWANPADGHPGEIVTEIYTQEVFRYLQEAVIPEEFLIRRELMPQSLPGSAPHIGAR